LRIFILFLLKYREYIVKDMAKSKKYLKKGRKTRKHMKKHYHRLGKTCSKCLRIGSMMKGGSCTSCSNNMLPVPGQSGGNNFYKPAAPIPGPFVGQSWDPPYSKWPGVDGVSNNRNYLAYNNYPTDPQTAMTLEGGSRNRRSKSKSKSRSKRGGLSFLPQDFVNLGRDIGYNLGSAYNALNGYEAPVNPLPYKDQLMGSRLNSMRSLLT
jgi:hypothetical protein